MLLFGITLSLFAAPSEEELHHTRRSLDSIANEVISAKIEDTPEFKEVLDSAEGYAVVSASSGIFALVGVGGAAGVLYHTQKNETFYIDISMIYLGVGIGAADFTGIIVFHDDEVIEQIKRRRFKGISKASSGVVGKESEKTRGDKKGHYTVYLSSQNGFQTATGFNIATAKINTQLTGMAISQGKIAFLDIEKKSQRDTLQYREWNRTLPILGGKLVEMGYDLPLPFGVSVSYAGVNQAMNLRDIQIGFNGSEKQPFEFVTFDNVQSNSHSAQVLLDFWLFPFMNIYGLVGYVGGDVPMDVYLDGNLILEHLEINCDRPIPNPLCTLLSDKTFVLPVKGNIDAITYGFGVTLAGGWNNWFVSIPFNMNWTNQSSSDLDGYAVTVAPRFGRFINLRKRGGFSPYLGANMLHSSYNVDGEFPLYDSNDTLLLTIDYNVDQENLDKWTILLGFNWDITKNFAVMAEYNGFVGSRHTVITMLRFRF